MYPYSRMGQLRHVTRTPAPTTSAGMFALIQNALTLGQSAAIVRSLIYQFNELSRVEGRLPRGGARPAALAIWYGMAGVQGFPLRVAGTFSGASPDSIEPVAFALMDRSERIEP